MRADPVSTVRGRNLIRKQHASASPYHIYEGGFTELIPCFLALLLSRFSKKGAGLAVETEQRKARSYRLSLLTDLLYVGSFKNDMLLFLHIKGKLTFNVLSRSLGLVSTNGQVRDIVLTSES